MLSSIMHVARRAGRPTSLLYQPSRRLLTTSNSPSTSTSTPNPRHRNRNTNLRTAYVRTWRPLANITEAYTMMRVLERKYGKILEAHFLKDFEVPTHYQSLAWIVFLDPKAIQRIPEKGLEFTIPVSNELFLKQPHELGMDDLENLAREGDYEEGFELAIPDPLSKDRFIGGKIVRAEQDFLAESTDRRLFQATAKPTMRAFLQWGGFHKLTPLPASSRTIKEEELFGKTEVDNVRMRAALQLAANVTRSANPAIAGGGTTSSAGDTPPRKDVLKDDSSPSFGSVVFGGLLGDKAPVANSSESRSGSDNTQSSPAHASTSTSPPSFPSPSSTQPLPPPAPTPYVTQPPPPQTQKKSAPAPPTPIQSPEEKEALERQLQVARQLRGSAGASPVRQKQAKPSLKTHRSPNKQQPQPAEPDFFKREDSGPPQQEKEKATGVLGRLWGMMGRR